MSHLTKQERCKIENFLLAGVTPQEMARNLGRSHTTINRELQRHRIVEDPPPPEELQLLRLQPEMLQSLHIVYGADPAWLESRSGSSSHDDIPS